MATRSLLAELLAAQAQAGGLPAELEAVGGVDAARRVRAGESFELVCLAREVIDALVAEGHLSPPRVDLVRSSVAVAVRLGDALPDLSSPAALRAAVEAAPSVAHSSGPSGAALLAWFERWGLMSALAPRLVQAPPGVPVGRLVAEGVAALGFQQLSELLPVQGITIAGLLPAELQVQTTFSAAVGAGSARPAQARELLQFLASPAHLPVRHRHGMDNA